MKILSLSFCFIAFFLTVQAKDLGVHGHTFPIAEEDLLCYLKNKLGQLNPNEQVALEEKLHQQYVKSIENPVAHPLPAATSYRSYEFDPTITLSKDIYNQQGKILGAKGSQFNPLKMLPLQQELLFFDSTQEKQLKWAKQHPLAKWILVKGNPLELEQQEKRAVYFDQSAYLVHKLGIQAIPATVSQKVGEWKLKVEEIAL